MKDLGKQLNNQISWCFISYEISDICAMVSFFSILNKYKYNLYYRSHVFDHNSFILEFYVT